MAFIRESHPPFQAFCRSCWISEYSIDYWEVHRAAVEHSDATGHTVLLRDQMGHVFRTVSPQPKEER